MGGRPISRRIFEESRAAARAAEVIDDVVDFRRVPCGRHVDLHAAHRIDGARRSRRSRHRRQPPRCSRLLVRAARMRLDDFSEDRQRDFRRSPRAQIDARLEFGFSRHRARRSPREAPEPRHPVCATPRGRRTARRTSRSIRAPARHSAPATRRQPPGRLPRRYPLAEAPRGRRAWPPSRQVSAASFKMSRCSRPSTTRTTS